MPVFDFNQEKKDAVKAEKTYELDCAAGVCSSREQ